MKLNHVAAVVNPRSSNISVAKGTTPLILKAKETPKNFSLLWNSAFLSIATKLFLQSLFTCIYAICKLRRKCCESVLKMLANNFEVTFVSFFVGLFYLFFCDFLNFVFTELCISTNQGLDKCQSFLQSALFQKSIMVSFFNF